jgi:hypothetical protein
MAGPDPVTRDLIVWGNRALALALLMGAVWLHGCHHGDTRASARWEARTATIRVQRAGAVALAAAQAQLIAQAAQDRAALMAELEDLANADPDADRPAFGPAAVGRLQRHR